MGRIMNYVRELDAVMVAQYRMEDAIRANVDNEKLSDEEFRNFIRNTLSLFYPTEEKKK